MSVIEKDVKQQTGWRNFTKGTWTKTVDVNDFLVHNLSPYYGDESFLAGATQNTKELWDIVSDLTKKNGTMAECLMWM